MFPAATAAPRWVVVRRRLGVDTVGMDGCCATVGVEAYNDAAGTGNGAAGLDRGSSTSEVWSMASNRAAARRKRCVRPIAAASVAVAAVAVAVADEMD